jgi:hypothetical protein
VVQASYDDAEYDWVSFTGASVEDWGAVGGRRTGEADKY